VSDIACRDITFKSADGITLYAQDCGPVDTGHTTLLCLPGLTRNHRDFEPVVRRFGRSRRVIALDFRGRGRSQWADPKTYRPDVEAADSIALLDHLALKKAALLGSSRGGLVGLVLGLMLNDVGPVLEKESLKRIASYVGKSVSFETWDEAAEALANGAVGFSNVSHAQWLEVAKRIYGDKHGRPSTEHDPGLAVNFPTVAQIDAGPLPNSWKLFEGLGGMPVGLLRGAGSDLLSMETASEMARRRPSLVVTTVADRGHIPFLDEPESDGAISQWLHQCDRL
jgi:pimeloyl-ACP methyl ester carboxylesterase